MTPGSSRVKAITRRSPPEADGLDQPAEAGSWGIRCWPALRHSPYPTIRPDSLLVHAGRSPSQLASVVVCSSTSTANSLPRAGDASGEGPPGGEVLLREHSGEGEEGEAHADTHALEDDPGTDYLEPGRGAGPSTSSVSRAGPDTPVEQSAHKSCWGPSGSRSCYILPIRDVRLLQVPRRQGVCAFLHRGLRRPGQQYNIRGLPFETCYSQDGWHFRKGTPTAWYILRLSRDYRWTYLRKRKTDVEKKLIFINQLRCNYAGASKSRGYEPPLLYIGYRLIGQ